MIIMWHPDAAIVILINSAAAVFGDGTVCAA